MRTIVAACLFGFGAMAQLAALIMVWLKVRELRDRHVEDLRDRIENTKWIPGDMTEEKMAGLGSEDLPSVGRWLRGTVDTLRGELESQEARASAEVKDFGLSALLFIAGVLANLVGSILALQPC